MWTPEIIRARFVEAADTERRLPKGGGASSAGYWPNYEYSFEDKAGWGTKRLAEERELRLRRIPPSSAAITRHNEVMEWTAERIEDPTRRHQVWAFAVCRLHGWSFSAKCRKHGWNRITAYDRLNTIFSRLANDFNNGDVLLLQPDQRWALQETEIPGSSYGKLGDVDDTPQKSPSAVLLPGSLATDLLKTDVDMEAFEKHLRAVNRVRRREQERQKRRFLGLSQGAA